MAKETSKQVMDIELPESKSKIELSINHIEKPKGKNLLNQRYHPHIIKNGLKENVSFCSRGKHPSFYVHENLCYKFTNHLFETNDPDAIEFIRELPVFGVEVMEGEIPNAWIKEFEEDEKWKSKDRNDIEPSYKIDKV